MTIAGFLIWLIANIIGGSAPLQFDPVNFWAVALLLAIAPISIARARRCGAVTRRLGAFRAFRDAEEHAADALGCGCRRARTETCLIAMRPQR